jgi:benzodiazapine receptor
MTETRPWIGLAVFLVVCLGAGGLGAIATTPLIEGWYKTIARPNWTPPGWIFGPVWTRLYILMAISAWLIWIPARFKAAAILLTLFGVQLSLNIA